MSGRNAAARREDRSGTQGMTDGVLETVRNGEGDWTKVRKQARRTRNPRSRKLVTEVNSARELLSILARLSIVPLDFYDTKSKGKYVLKLTRNNWNYFDNESTRRKMAKKKKTHWW